MNDENDELMGNDIGNENNLTNDNSTSMRNRITEKATKKMTKKIMEKGTKTAVAKGSTLAAIGPILFWVFVAIVFIIIIIGIVMFLVTMPGMVMEQLKAIAKDIGDYIAAFAGADTTQQIDEKDIYESLDYLEQMGYDLKGYGFLTDYKTEADVASFSQANVEPYLDEKIGVIRNREDDRIVDAYSDFIFTYMVSDNYVYTLKNDNLATQEMTDNWFGKLGVGITTSWYKMRNFLYGPVFDFLGITNAVGET